MGIFNNSVANNINIKPQAQTFSKKQFGVLAKSLFVATGGFVAICLISLISYFLVLKKLSYSAEANATGLIITMVVMFGISFISTFVWSWFTKLEGKAFVFWGIFAWISYVISQGIAFSIVYLLLNAAEIAVIFSVAVVIYGLLAFIGYRMKDKTAAKVATVYKWALIICLTFFFVGMIAAIIINIAGKEASLFNWYYTAIGGCIFSILILLSISLTFKHLSQISEFTKLSDNAETSQLIERRLIWLLGFNILVQFIALLWQIIRFYLMLKR